MSRLFPLNKFLVSRVAMIVMLVMAVLILTACNGDRSSPTGSDEPVELPPVAVVKAREALAAELNVEVDEVSIESYERAEWTDSCLGLGGAAESCLAALHPGWQVMLNAEGEAYEVRTDELGDIIRIKQ